jgi:hypothetical protein
MRPMSEPSEIPQQARTERAFKTSRPSRTPSCVEYQPYYRTAPVSTAVAMSDVQADIVSAAGGSLYASYFASPARLRIMNRFRVAPSHHNSPSSCRVERARDTVSSDSPR